MNTLVFAYHRLCCGPKSHAYDIGHEEFSRHMEWITHNRFQSLSVEDFFSNGMSQQTNGAGSSVLITFDDGHASDHALALGVLRMHGLIGNFFVTTDWIGRPGYMGQGELKNLVREGMFVQSHGASHRFLDGMEAGEIRQELKGSKDRLEEITGKEVRHVSFPGGRFNNVVTKIAAESGYVGLFSSRPFSLRRQNGMLVCGRSMIESSPDGSNLQEILTASRLHKLNASTRYGLKYLARKLVGNRVYHDLWRKCR